jgi:TolB-like protein/DNA-binding winged helix-turn-helix (wHTH) protein/Tfp pilus assembly protein PilF
MPLIEERRQFRFGDFVVNPRARTLHRQGIRLKLHRQPFELLLLLLEHPGEVVTREQIAKVLWPGTFVDCEHGMNTVVKKLRQILGDSADNPRYIETVPRVGYRFAAELQRQELPQRPPETVSHSTVESSSEPSYTLHKNRVIGKWLIAVASLILLSAISTVYFLHFRQRSSASPVTGRVMLAVLPFENLTGDPDQEYFSDGLTEEMISQLGRVAPTDLGIIAPASVMPYKQHPQELDQIGRQLGVEYVLEGSVRRDSQNVRIAARLVQLKDQKLVWSRQYDRGLTDLLVLQGEIAQEIADEIQLTLGGSHNRSAEAAVSKAPPFAAYDLYLRGRYFLNKRSAPGFQQAIAYFQQAIAKDPSYAQAYVGLADSYALTSSYNDGPPNELIPRARAAALKALQINDSLAEAHTALAVIAQNYDWDWQTAEKEYRRAIELDPNYPTAHHWYAECLALQGKFSEAFTQIDRARQLDPLSLIILADRGAFLYFDRQYDRAIEQFRTVGDMDPNFPRKQLIISAYIQKGMRQQALASIAKWPVSQDDAWGWMWTAYTYGRLGRHADAERALSKLQELYRGGKADAQRMAMAYIGMGQNEKAIAFLQKARDEHSISTALKVDPLYDPLRSDPGFQALLRNMHLAQ